VELNFKLVSYNVAIQLKILIPVGIAIIIIAAVKYHVCLHLYLLCSVYMMCSDSKIS